MTANAVQLRASARELRVTQALRFGGLAKVLCLCPALVSTGADCLPSGGVSGERCASSGACHTEFSP
eukprot:2348349-Rhodomonas_salina.2